jgi:hypothetical protein
VREVASEVETSVTEQRTNTEFCVLLHKSAAETLTMSQQAYGDRAMKKSQVYDWHKRFQDGRESADCDAPSVRASTSINKASVGRVQASLAVVYS